MSDGIIITDSKPLPRDGSCPRCGAKERDRIIAETFGRLGPRTFCGKCGHEFKEQD